MWDLQRALFEAQDETARLGHKLGPFQHVNSLVGAWKAACERCGRVCIVARSAGDPGVRRSGDALTEPCRQRRFARIRRIGISEIHRAIGRLELAATHTKPPRGLSAALAAKLRIPSRRCRKDASTPEAVSLVDVGVGSTRHVASGSR